MRNNRRNESFQTHWKSNFKLLFKDRRIEKESLKDYINKKREMFLVQVNFKEYLEINKVVE